MWRRIQLNDRRTSKLTSKIKYPTSKTVIVIYLRLVQLTKRKLKYFTYFPPKNGSAPGHMIIGHQS